MALYSNTTFLNAKTALSAGDIDAAERAIGRTLPQALREHYLEANGGKPDKQMFVAPDGVKLVVHAFLALGGGKGEFEQAFRWAKVDTPFLPEDLIPFADDPGGDYFCLSDGAGRAGQVFFFYSERADKPAEATLLLAPSLQAFIENLEQES